MQVSNKLVVSIVLVSALLTACDPHQVQDAKVQVAKQETETNTELAKTPGLADCQYYIFNNMQVLRCPNSTVDVQYGKNGHNVVADNTHIAEEEEDDVSFSATKKCKDLTHLYQLYNQLGIDDTPHKLMNDIKEACKT